MGREPLPVSPVGYSRDSRFNMLNNLFAYWKNRIYKKGAAFWSFQMLKEYAFDIADKMGIRLASVSVVECHSPDCKAAYLLILAADAHTVKTLVYKSEIDKLYDMSDTGQLHDKIHVALLKLKSYCKDHPLLRLF